MPEPDPTPDPTLYASLETLKTSLSIQDSETSFDEGLTRALAAASRGIDNVTERRFYPDTTDDNERFYEPTSRGLMLIDDLIELRELATGPQFADEWEPGTDFALSPANPPAGEPWTAVEAHARAFPTGPRSVRITGRWGWPEPPPGVVEATLIIATKIFKRVREAPFGIVAVGDAGEAMRLIRSDPDVRFLIEDYESPQRAPLVR